MALEDFFSPIQSAASGMSPEVMGFLQNPRGQAALLQAGLNLMGGPAWGDTGASQIARAVGSGGEALGRQEAEDLKAQEAASKQTLREAQATNAEARANAATARAGQAGTTAELARERLGIARSQEEGRQQRALLGGRIRLSGMYQNYLKDVAKRNADPLRTGTPEVPLGMTDWIKQNPTLSTLGLIPEGTTGAEIDDEAAPAATPGTAAVPGAPRVGETRRGYRFKGGDPAQQESWEKI